jgi:hypothetical protein
MDENLSRNKNLDNSATSHSNEEVKAWKQQIKIIKKSF